MNYRKLGRTGIKVSEVGLGSEAFVGRDDGFAQELLDAALQAVKSGEIDVIMFSVNPAYDILPPNEDVDTLFEKSTYDAPDVLSSTDPERLELYRFPNACITA